MNAISTERARDKFYVYLHSRPSSEVFYVGKGCGKRAHDFESSRNPHHKRLRQKLGAERVTVQIFPCGSEQLALAVEVDIIDVLRKAGHRLCNLTDGGDGVSGYRPTAEAIERAASKLRGRKLTAEHRAKMSESRRGREVSDETRRKISEALTGRRLAPFTDEARFHMAQAAKQRAPSASRGPNISRSLLGKTLTEAHRSSLSASHMGKAWSLARRAAFERTRNAK